MSTPSSHPRPGTDDGPGPDAAARADAQQREAIEESRRLQQEFDDAELGGEG